MPDDPAPAGPKQGPRGGSTRFQLGKSGNPAGRKRGSYNRATQLAKSLLAGETEAIMRRLIEAALDKADPAHSVALKLAVERLIAPARHEPSLKGIALPAMNSARDLPLVTAGLLRAVLDGKLSLPDVMPALEIVRTTATAISTADHDERLADLERLVVEKQLRHGN